MAYQTVIEKLVADVEAGDVILLWCDPMNRLMEVLSVEPSWSGGAWLTFDCLLLVDDGEGGTMRFTLRNDMKVKVMLPCNEILTLLPDELALPA